MTLTITNKQGTWHVEGQVLGVRVRRSTRYPATSEYKAHADRMRIDIENEIITGNYQKTTVKVRFHQVCDAYLDFREQENRSSRDLIRVALMWNDVFGSQVLTDITTASVQDYVTKEMRHLSAGSIKRYLNVLIAILNYAKETVENYNGIKVIKPRVEDARDVHFSEREANMFLRWVRESRTEYYPHFLTLIDTGARLNEMLSLRLMHFDDGAVQIRRRLERSGKSDRRDIPLTKDMAEMVNEFFGSKRYDEVLYTSATGHPFASADSASAMLNRVLKAAHTEVGLPEVRVHDLRHTFAYLTAKAGADLGDLQYLMGHRDIKMTMRYRGFIPSRASTYVANARTQLEDNGQVIAIGSVKRA